MLVGMSQIIMRSSAYLVLPVQLHGEMFNTERGEPPFLPVCFSSLGNAASDLLSCVLLDGTGLLSSAQDLCSAVGSLARLLLCVVHTAHRNRLHKLVIFQAGFVIPIKNEVFDLENLNSCVL